MLDINEWLLLSTIIVFITLIVVLNSWLVKPMFDFMQMRDSDLKRDLDQVGSNEDEINEMYAKAKQIINDAKLEAAALRDKVITEAKDLANSKIEAKRSELQSEMAKFKEGLVTQEEQLKNSLLAQVPLYKEAAIAKFTKI